MKAAAGLCALCVVLSGAFGFGGTMLANRLSGSGAVSAETKEALPSSSNRSVVVYKSAQGTPVSATAKSGEPMTYAQVAAMVKDSVVEINTEYTTRNAWFQYTTGGAGSGVILSDDGYIITNAHVILDSSMQTPADTVTVRLTDGTEYPAEVISYDTDEDIAIVKIDAKDLLPAQVGDSDKLIVGEELIIVGNPLGKLGGSVSNGIVSATEREIQVGGVTMHLIQTNAAVNPGNSGGGMFNMKGELVGIVNAKSSGMGIEGLGFAIPVNQVMKVSEQLLTQGYVSGKPMIGVSFEDVGSDSGLSFFGFGSGAASNVKPGVYVRELVEGMNDKVLEEGDRVIAVNGEEISSSDDIKAIVSASAIGDKITFQLYRENKLMEVEVTVFERTPDVTAKESAKTENDEKEKDEKKTDDKKEEKKPYIGVSLTESSGTSNMKKGVYIASLSEGFNEKVLEAGDRIVAINGEEITSVSDVKSIVAESSVGDKLDFRVSRDGKLIAVEVTVFERPDDLDTEAEPEQEEPEENSSGSTPDMNSFFDFFSDFFGRR
jgi:serine protease Do